VMLLGAGLSAAEVFVPDKARSRIAVDARATNHSFTGILTAYDLRIEGRDGSAEPTRVELKWDFKHLDTADKKRNRNMLKWLEHARTPTGSFVMTKWIRDAKGRTFSRGKITIHGVTREVTFPCTIRREGHSLTASGIAVLNYKDFGLPIIRQLAILTVKPELRISFRLVGTAK
ncbi:MAG: YceI family protein, partial [Akkermansiaceae bacterium]|nr:YceI family protein [Akkermansiaceae bacterium]